MNRIISLLKEFETRNNISAFIEVFGDESFVVREFWEGGEVFLASSISELEAGLKNKTYKKDESDGRCLSPFQEISN